MPVARRQNETESNATTVISNVVVRKQDGSVKSYVNMTSEWHEFVNANGGRDKLSNDWYFLRQVEMLFLANWTLTSVEGWVRLNDMPYAYFVRATRDQRNRRMARYIIIGAAQTDELPASDLSPSDWIEEKSSV